MQSKTHNPPDLTDEEMVERVRSVQEEDRKGELIHCETEDDVRAFFASHRSRQG